MFYLIIYIECVLSTRLCQQGADTADQLLHMAERFCCVNTWKQHPQLSSQGLRNTANNQVSRLPGEEHTRAASVLGEMDVPWLLLHLFFKLSHTHKRHTSQCYCSCSTMLSKLVVIPNRCTPHFVSRPPLNWLNTHKRSPHPAGLLHQCQSLRISKWTWRWFHLNKNFTILGSRFSTSWGWKTVMRASVLTALLLSFCPTISVTSSGLSSKWLMSDWHSPRIAFMIKTRHLSMSESTLNCRINSKLKVQNRVKSKILKSVILKNVHFYIQYSKAV